MVCIRSRLWQSGPIFILCSLVLVMGFLLQFHILYTVHQKNNRILEYKMQMTDLYETMKSVERVANNTETLIKKLQRIVTTHRASKMKLLKKIS